MKGIFKVLLCLNTLVFLGCGAAPVDQSFSDKQNIPRATYTYLDAWGNQYVITKNKLEYTPASEENSVDGYEDQGRYSQLNITLNEYGKIASVCDAELARAQDLPYSTNDSLPVPSLTRSFNEVSSTDLDLDGVRELNFILKPFLKANQ